MNDASQRTGSCTVSTWGYQPVTMLRTHSHAGYANATHLDAVITAAEINVKSYPPPTAKKNSRHLAAAITATLIDKILRISQERRGRFGDIFPSK